MTNDTHKHLAYFTRSKNAYLHEFYQRILEIEFLQKKMWELYDNNEKNPQFQLDCIRECRMLTMTLVGLYKILPNIIGFEFQYENNQSALLRKDNQIRWTDEESKAFEDEANDSGEAKF